ncbi:MAG TPA: hypothetical protein DF383_12085 [Deltaproteobacteria bacterium]|nr:hypothetical protein [Deltaproteobacteria bacterium]
MLKRFLTVFGLILLYMLALASADLMIVLLAGKNDTLIRIMVVVTLVFSVATMVPYMDWVAKKVFRFNGEGKPVSEAELRAQIQTINQFDVPVMIEERKGKLVATWKYVDAHWRELLSKAGLTKVYELHIKFDHAQHLVTLIDVTKSVSWGAGPTELRLRWSFFRGIMLTYEIGKQWGIKESWKLGQVYDYKFRPKEVKMPIMNSILRSGWDVRFGIW